MGSYVILISSVILSICISDITAPLRVTPTRGAPEARLRTIPGTDIRFALRDGDYNADNTNYEGFEIPGEAWEALCDEASEYILGYQPDTSRQPTFGAYNVNFLCDGLDVMKHHNLLRCPARLADYYVKKMDNGETYNIYKTWTGRPYMPPVAGRPGTSADC